MKHIESNLRRLLLGCVAIVAALTVAGVAVGDGREAKAGSAVIAVAQLPLEARQTLHLIDQGGPFPYSRDAIVFGNYTDNHYRSFKRTALPI